MFEDESVLRRDHDLALRRQLAQKVPDIARMGLIQKLEISGTEARFDGNVGRHHHVRCVRCGSVNDVHGLPADLLGEESKALSGYEILGYRLEFSGVCRECGGQSAQQEPSAGAHDDG